MVLKIEVSKDYNTTKFKVPIKLGTLKEIKNHNKQLDLIEFSTANFNVDNKDVLERFSSGSYIWVDDKLKYIINASTKIKSGRKDRWQIEASGVSLTFILQKIILPNKSVRHRVGSGSLKTVKEEIDKLMSLYFSQFRDYNNWVNNYPDELETSEEFTWNQPTLYEAICDLSSNANLTPYLTFVNDKFNLDFVKTSELGAEYPYPQFINQTEEKEDIEFAPQRMTNLIENNISDGVITESNLYPTSNIGVFVDNDENAYYQTTYKINEIKGQTLAKITLPSRSDITNTLRHPAGTYVFDISKYIITKEVYDSLPLKEAGSKPGNIKDNEFRNCYLYYEKDSRKIKDAFQQYSSLFGTGKTVNLTFIMLYIVNYDQDSLLVYPEALPLEDPPLINFWVDEAKDVALTINYQVMDKVRFDITKDSGFGTLVQNQGSAFINFNAYRRQQEDVMRRLGNIEVIAYGRVKDKKHLPQNGMSYKGNLIVQTIFIYTLNYIDFMFIATSQFNKIDGDAVINTKKRFTSILSPEASVERHEYLELEMNQERFNKIKNQVTITNDGETIKKVFVKLHPAPEETEFINTVYLNYLVQNISENEILVTFKTEDNYFAGYQRIIEDGVELIKGVSYTDIYGEFVTASIRFVEVSDEDVSFKYLPNELGYETNVSPVYLNAFRYKDGGERLAMSILIKVV